MFGPCLAVSGKWRCDAAVNRMQHVLQNAADSSLCEKKKNTRSNPDPYVILVIYSGTTVALFPMCKWFYVGAVVSFRSSRDLGPQRTLGTLQF